MRLHLEKIEYLSFNRCLTRLELKGVRGKGRRIIYPKFTERYFQEEIIKTQVKGICETAF